MSRAVTTIAATVVAGAALLSGAPVAFAAAAAPAASGNLAPAIEVEPRALSILKGASDRLASAKTLSFKAVTTEESPSRLGPPLTYFSEQQVTLRRPDALRVITNVDGPQSEFYYDGKTVTAYAPKEDMVATAPAPATIDAMLDGVFKQAQIYFPYTDMIVSDPYKGLSDGLRVAFYIGTTDAVGGVQTYIVAYANDNAFVQAWIGVKDRLPRRLQAVFRQDPKMLRHSVDLSDWKVDAPVLPGTFDPPAKAKKALPIKFGAPQAPAAAKQ
ncbi:MAG: DUF2092 domain-containing protein [Steroidobacteraceae bacterium]